VRERTEELCAVIGLNTVQHGDKVKLLMQEMLDVAVEGWLSTKTPGQ
jgi:hypothetical protein